MTKDLEMTMILGVFLCALGASWSYSPVLVVAGLPILLSGFVFASYTCAESLSHPEGNDKVGYKVLCALGVLGVVAGACLGAHAIASFYDVLGRNQATQFGSDAALALFIGGIGAAAIAWGATRVGLSMPLPFWKLWLYWFSYTLAAMAMTLMRVARHAPF